MRRVVYCLHIRCAVRAAPDARYFQRPPGPKRRSKIVNTRQRTIKRAAGISILNAVLGVLAYAQDTHYAPKDQQIPPPACFTIRGAWEGGYVPCNAGSHDAWLKDVTHWRDERRIRIGFDPARYEMPALKWTQSSFMQPQMMVHDRY